MKRTVFAILVGAAFGVAAAAQSSDPQASAQAGASADTKASAQAGNKQVQASGRASANTANAAQAGESGASLASGTAINAALNGSVDARKNKPGDTVNARTTEAVKSDGKVVLPKGTKLIGHVTEAKARAKGESESALGIVFERAILKNGQEVALDVAIQAIAAAQSSAAPAAADFDSMAGAGASAGRSAGGAGLGAVGGLTSAAGGAVGAVTNTAANVGGAATGAVGSTVNSTANPAGSAGSIGGLNAAGQLASNSRGVFGLNGLNLSSAASNSAHGSVITSTGKNVHLDSGTRLLLVSQAQAAAQGESKDAGEKKAAPKPERPERQNP